MEDKIETINVNIGSRHYTYRNIEELVVSNVLTLYSILESATCILLAFERTHIERNMQSIIDSTVKAPFITGTGFFANVNNMLFNNGGIFDKHTSDYLTNIDNMFVKDRMNVLVNKRNDIRNNTHTPNEIIGMHAYSERNMSPDYFIPTYLKIIKEEEEKHGVKYNRDDATAIIINMLSPHLSYFDFTDIEYIA